MSLQIQPPLLKEYHLEESDKTYKVTETPTMISVRQATQGDEISRNRLFAMVEKQYKKDSNDEEVVSFTSDVSMDDVWSREVFLTLAACNIVEGADDREIFKFKNDRISMSPAEFSKSWGKLPWDVAQEIIKCVHDLNIQWSPSGNV